MKNINCTIILFFVLLFYSCGKIESFTELDTPRFSGDYAPTLTFNPNEIKIVNFNIEFAIKIEQAIQELGTSENLKDADVIFLQEMDELGTEAIAQALEYNFVYYPASRNDDGSLFGQSILSKWPIIEDEKFLLPHEAVNGRRRIATTALLDIGDQTVSVYNVHTATFTLPKSKRREQFRTIISHLNQSEANEVIDHVIIAGDYNTDKNNDIDYLVDIHEAEGFVWASEEVGPTYQILSGLSPLTLDHVFIRGLDLISAGKNKETKASDHLPMWFNLRFI